MVFVYPAVFSPQILPEFIPGITKNMEKYFLHHIRTAAAAGNIRFYVNVSDKGSKNPKHSEIMLEGSDMIIPSGMDYLMEGAVDDAISKAQERRKALEVQEYKWNKTVIRITTGSAYESWMLSAGTGIPDKKDFTGHMVWSRKPGTIAIDLKTVEYTIPGITKLHNTIATYLLSNPSHVPENGWESKINQWAPMVQILAARDKAESELSDVRRRISSTDQELSRLDGEKREKDVQPVSRGADVQISAVDDIDMRPTTESITARVRIYDTKAREYVGEEDRTIPIGVKVVPLRVSGEFGSLYDLLQDDYYSNWMIFRYKQLVRGISTKIVRFFRSIGREFMSIIRWKDDEEFDMWRDIILNSKGLVDSSSFSKRRNSPSYYYYSAASIIFSSHDIKPNEESVFDKPQYMARLFKMGWNHIGVMDDPGKKFLFCSSFERGMCTSIPYSILYNSIKAADTFKEIQDIRGNIMNFKKINFKSMADTIRKRQLSEQIVRDKFNKFSEK